MFSATREFIDKLQEKNIHYTYNGYNEDQDVDILKIGYTGDNMKEISVNFFISDSKISVRIWNICQIPDDNEKRGHMLIVINALNQQMNYFKFVMDTDDYSIDMHYDMVAENDVGDTCLALLTVVVKAVDESYPLIMKGLWM